MNDIHFVIGTTPSWPHSDDKHVISCAPPSRPTPPVHHEHRLVRTFPPNTLPRPQHQVCSCTPSARIMATNIRPDHARYPNSLRPPLCYLLPRQTNFSTGLWDDRRLSTFLRCIALMGPKFCFSWKRNLGSAGIAMRYTLHGLINTLFPPILASSACNVMVLCRSPELRCRPPRYLTIEMEWRESPMSFE